uniref:AlkB homolog 7 n=1 Tax=Sinocyclocheilus rhinocerous TaxID=307959 RepID=A0A673MCD5_9TELE
MTLLIRVSKQVQRKSFQNPLLYRFSSESSALRKGSESRAKSKWLFGSFQEIFAVVHGHVEVRHNFISEEEENVLFKEVETGLRKKQYEFDHWDDAIHSYRETELAFPEDSPLLGPVHVLDLDKDSYIKPHIDSVKVCERINPASSLLSDIVMRLVPENKSTDWVDLLLSRRSLYILRYIPSNPFSQKVPRHRRISVICPNLPV